MLERRTFLTGLAALITAPAIVRAGSLMPVRVVVEDLFDVYNRYGPLSDLAKAQHMINLRRSAVLKYLEGDLFRPYMGTTFGPAPVLKSIA